jgi:hypothetical protein
VTDDEIRAAVKTLKQLAVNVIPLTMTAERHVRLIELIIDSEAILRGFKPTRPRNEIEAAIEQELQVR